MRHDLHTLHRIQLAVAGLIVAVLIVFYQPLMRTLLLLGLD